MADFTINILGEDIDGNHQIGEPVLTGDLLYLGTDSKWYKASASSKTTSTTELSMALEDGVANDYIRMLLYGYFEAYPYTVLVPGSKYYVSITNGRITTTKYSNSANVIRYIGTAHNDTILLFNPDQTYISDFNFKVNDEEINTPLPDHTHTESEITDLDKYTQAEVDALLAAVGDNHYEHVQDVSSASWVIAHNLGKKPSVVIQDGSGNTVYGDIVYTDDNNLTLNFTVAFTGVAYLN